MLARLWWKEGRTLAPIAATVILAAVALQMFLTSYASNEAHSGFLISLGIGWAILYALVAASASFAGERETRMLALLDALPVDRKSLWLGKATFALGSSLVLAFALMIMGTAASYPLTSPGLTAGVRPAGLYLILFESVAWGLLWSSLCRTAIAAGIGAVVSVGVVASLLPVELPDHPLYGWSWPGRIVLLIGAVGASWVVLTREGQPHRGTSTLTIRLQLPTRRGPQPSLGTVGLVPAATRRRRAILPTPAFYRLVWQTVREGFGTWLLTLAVAAVSVVVGLLFYRDGGINTLMIVGLVALLILVQGVSVFGLENTAGTRLFLDHQAVPPGTVWAARVVPWLGALGVATVIVSILAGVCVVGWRELIPFWPDAPGRAMLLGGLLVYSSAILDAFGVGLIAGMLFRRRVTATLVGLLGLAVVAAPQLVVVQLGTAPFWAAAVGPVILLAVSRGWAADWLGDRGGVGRWVRLGALAVVPILPLTLAYIGGRAYGITDIGPQGTGTPPFAITTAQSPAVQAVETLAGQIGPLNLSRDDLSHLAARGWAQAPPDVRGLWAEKAAFAAEVRALAGQPGPIDLDLTFAIARLPALTQLLMLDALERRSRGDFAGAWDDIRAQIQLGDRFAAGAQSSDAYRAALLRVDSALRQGVAWASDSQITPEAIDAARASLRDLRAIPSADGAVRHEADRLESLLDRSTSEWVDELVPRRPAQAEALAAFERIINAWLIAPSWERERTRRIVRRMIAQTLVAIRTDRPLRLTSPGLPQMGGSPLWTPLANQVIGPVLFTVEGDADQSRTVRELLDLFLILRRWQVTHGGHAPTSLAEVFGGDESRVPRDPLAGTPRPFGYERMGLSTHGPSSYFLWSAGLDTQDHRGRTADWVGFDHQYSTAFEDIVFALPPEPPGSAVGELPPDPLGPPGEVRPKPGP